MINETKPVKTANPTGAPAPLAADPIALKDGSAPVAEKPDAPKAEGPANEAAKS